MIGLVAGVASTLVVKKQGPTTHYYKATNTLAQAGGAGNGASGPSTSDYTMSQAALLAQSSELLDKVGKATHLTRAQVASQLSATIRTDVNAIDVTAIGTKPNVAVQIGSRDAAHHGDIESRCECHCPT